jgi:TRAP-type C4-dicarboxylate transport system substrate-binding protein
LVNGKLLSAGLVGPFKAHGLALVATAGKQGNRDMRLGRTKAFVATVFAVFGLACATSAAAQEKFEWTMATPLTPAIGYLPLYQEMLDRIAERSDGRLKITLLVYGQHPYSGADIMNAVRDGILQMGNSTDSYVTAQEPAIGFMALPFQFDSLAHAKAVYAAMKEPYFGELFDEKYNASMLTGFLVSGAAIHSDAPLNTLDALDGRKIRVFGKESGRMIELLGGSPVTVAFGELYTALQRGTINGALTGMVGAQAAKVYEVVNHNTWWNWSYALEFVIVNKDALKSLPEDLQTIVREEAEITNAELQALQDRLPAEILVESLEKYGIASTGLTPEMRRKFQEATRPIIDDWIASNGEAGKLASELFASVSASR